MTAPTPQTAHSATNFTKYVLFLVEFLHIPCYYCFCLFVWRCSLSEGFESSFVGRGSIVKERFSKKYRHPTLDSKLTLKRLNAVSYIYHEFFFHWFSLHIVEASVECFL